jgi:hypothetical protein
MDSIAAVTPQLQFAAKLWQNGYFPLPCQGKAPIGVDWNLRKDPGEVPYYDNCTVGIRCGGDNNVLGIDVDLEDENVGLAIVFALGFRSLERIGRPGRRLLLVRTTGETLSHDLTFEKDGRREKIQLIGKGRQFIAFGTHPDTQQPYRWTGKSPLDVPVGELLAVDQEALERTLVEVAMRFGWRQRIVARVAGAQALDSIPRDDRERAALEAWGVRQVEEAIAELKDRMPGTGRGTFALELGLRVGTLVSCGMLDGQKVADAVFAATDDYNAAYHSFPRGCAMSAGEAAVPVLETLRRGPLLLAQAAEMGMPVGDFLSVVTTEQVVEKALESGDAQDVVTTLRDRAASLGASRKSKTVTEARASFSRLCVALAGRGVISEREAFELGVLAKDYGAEQIATGQNPRRPGPDDLKLAEVVVETAKRGGDIGPAIVHGVAVLKPPTVIDDLAELAGGTWSTDEKMFELVCSRLASVNRDGSIFYVHRTMEGKDETLSDRDLMKLYPNVFVGDENGRETAVAWWMKHPKFKVKRAVFKTSGACQDDEYNFWRGFGVERMAGRDKVRRFIRHVWRIVCMKDRAKFKYMLRWLAWAVQNPGRNPETVVVLKSPREGSGKTTVSDVMRVLFGKHAVVITEPEQLLGKHNTHLEFASFVALEEALFAGDPRQASAMRSRITGATIRIEPKFIGSYEAPNIMHAILTTNHDWAIHAGQGARRWFVCEVSEERLGDEGYFNALYGDLEAGGYEQLLDMLLEVDLLGWHPRQLVRTEELAEQQRMSADSVTQWLAAAAEDGGIGYQSPAGTYSVLGLECWWHTSTLYGAYCFGLRQTGGSRPVSRDAFAKRLRAILGVRFWSNHVVEPGSVDGRQARGYFLPAAHDLRIMMRV